MCSCECSEWNYTCDKCRGVTQHDDVFALLAPEPLTSGRLLPADRRTVHRQPREQQAAVTDVTPYPKQKQLARGERRYRRKVASPKQWQAIIAEKQGPCRICGSSADNGRLHGHIQMHHVVPRVGGDDLADNIVPLCPDCHDRVTRREPDSCCLLVFRLTDDEYCYAIDRLGEQVWERCYGIRYTR